MNVLSVASIMIATAFGIGGVFCLTRKRKLELNFFAFAVLLLLGWWSFCSAFFYSAETEEEAWLWHRLSSIGWVGFIPGTSYYFLILTGANKRMRNVPAQCVYYALPATLLLHSLFGDFTCIATGLTRSTLGRQWTYTNSVDNGWLWLYLFCLALYFGISFYSLLRWASNVTHKMKKRLAISFICLDSAVILAGFVTDVLFPLTTHAVPAVASLVTSIFGACYFLIIIRYDPFDIYNVVSDKDIIRHSSEAILVSDEKQEILFCNPVSAELIGAPEKNIRGLSLSALIGVERAVALGRELHTHDTVRNFDATLSLSSGEKKQLMISAAVIRDQHREYIGTVFSLRDVTQLNQLKENYRKQAYTDALTGIPNRRKTFEVLKRKAELYDISGTDFAILYIDVDCFKTINDKYGHNIGDAFLKEVVNRLLSRIDPRSVFLGRLGGDELMMIFDARTNVECARVEENVHAAFSREMLVDGIPIQSSVSIGSALYSMDRDIDQMIQRADSKMYLSKQKKKAGKRC